MTSMARATGIAFQTDAATPATDPDLWLNYVQSCTIEPVTTSMLMKVEGGTRAMIAARIPGTIYSRVKLVVFVDSREFVRLLLPGMGYGYASATHHLYWGDDPATWLTLWHYAGITGEAWQVSGCVLNTVEMPRDYTGNGIGTATLEYLGYARAVIADPGSARVAPSTHYTPFTAVQSVLLYNGAAFCPLSGTVHLSNDVQPRYCGPSADATTSDPVYLAPDELQPREATGTIDLTAAYLGYTGSPLADSDSATERPVTLKLRDPVGTATSHLWTFPRVSAEPGTLDDGTSNPEQRQTIKGDLLRNSAGRIAILDVVNDEGDYLA